MTGSTSGADAVRQRSAPSASTSRPSNAVVIPLAVLIALVTAVYRFNLLGGALGGFENDEFTIVSRAAAMLHGELPSRDFLDPGVPLTLTASALTMGLADGALIGHAALTVTMLSIGAALTFVAAVFASNSVSVGLLVALIQFALAPRHYNYGKVVFFAAAILAWWAYVARPTTRRLTSLAVLTAVAFLFRHDHGVFIATGTAVLMIAMVPEDRITAVIRRACIYGGVVLACLAPYGVYLSRYGGVIDHFRVGANFIDVDRARTSLRWPRLTLDWHAPLIEVAAPQALARPTVKVRWRTPSPSAATRAEFVQRHHLQLRGVAGTEGGEYQVLDESPANLQAIASDPLVLDTHNIDRAVWRILERSQESWSESLRRQWPVLRVRVAPGILRADNAASFVYYVWLAIPPIAAAVLMATLWRRDAANWVDVLRMGPLVVVTGLLNSWFLRGTLPVRLADVSVLTGVIGAWLLVRVMSRRTWGTRVRTTVVRVAALAPLTLLVFASLSTGAVAANLWGVTDGEPPFGILRRARAVAQQLGTPGPVLAKRLSAGSSIMRAADYLNTCLPVSARALVTGYRPEMFYFSDRGFAGGNVEFRPGYWAGDALQHRTIAQLEAQSVPVVITDAHEVFETRYRSEWRRVVEFLDATYQNVGDRDFGGEVLNVRVHRQAKVVGRYPSLDLPCFR